MYAVIHDGGREFRVAEGDTLEVALRQDLSPGDEVVFPRVLLVRRGDDDVVVGRPTVDGAEVKATVQGTVKGDKVVAYKFKRRQGYHRKKGHRQKYTRVRITGITV